MRMEAGRMDEGQKFEVRGSRLEICGWKHEERLRLRLRSL
jgi:hypothetical protein